MKQVGRVEVDEGLHLGFEVHGSDSSHPPLVLVHGFMGSAASWDDLPERLARRRRVIVPDLPGHGRSDRSVTPADYRVPRMAALLGRLAEHLRATGADWLGYSMGGRIVLAGVAEGSIAPRRLVLESSSPGLEQASDRAARCADDEALALRLETEGLAPFVDDWLRRPLFSTLPAAARARARAVRIGNDPQALAACLRGGGTGSQRSYWEDLGRIQAPTRILTGGRDLKFTALGRRMADALPQGTLSTLAGVGHALHAEAPARWMAEVSAWIDTDD